MKIPFFVGISFILTAASFNGNAASISDFDLNTFDFNITSITGSNPNRVASGTSNGVGWTISPTYYWSQRTVTNGTFAYDALPVTTDSLHASADYMITFDQVISSLLVAVSNDNGSDSINFGLTASDSTGASLIGTQVELNNSLGGLVLFENINSNTIFNVNTNVLDGYDLAFHVTQIPR